MQIKKIIFIITLFATASLLGFGETVLKIEPVRAGKSVQLRYSLTPGYGVQKKADNYLTVYALKPGHEKEKKTREKIKKYGVSLGSLNQFSGRTAAKDKDYYDRLNNSSIALSKAASGALLLEGRIFYCSFSDKFCSVQSVSQLIP